jgi:CcmD family protein
MKNSVLYLVGLLLFISNALFAENESMTAELMRQNGKIYVVVGVLVIIFIGIIVYMITLDRRISRMEKSDKS